MRLFEGVNGVARRALVCVEGEGGGTDPREVVVNDINQYNGNRTVHSL